MMRIFLLAALIVVIVRWATGRWPWEFLQAKPSRARSVFEARKALGVGASATAEDIRAAHRKLLLTAHPDHGGSSAELERINAARDLLLDEADARHS